MTSIMMKRPVYKHIPKAHRHMRNQHCRNKYVASNIVKNEDGFTIQLAVPGINKSNIDLYVEKNILHVGMKEMDKQKSTESKQYMLKQFDYSSFCKRFEIPEDIDRDKIQASYERGILNIKLTKGENAEIKREINIQ